MIKLPKAASIAAISVTLMSTVIFGDAGFAFGSNQNDTALKADTILVDEAIIAADTKATDKTEENSSEVNGNQAIIYVPSIDAPAPKTGQSDMVAHANIRGASLTEMVHNQETSGKLDAEAHCLAGAVYFESKGESLAGQLAVARVVMARSKSGRFPGSLCGVVFQKSQFSFVRGNAMPNIDTGSQNWRNAVAISKIALSDGWKSPVEGALFFHARRVSPGWRLTRLGTVDNHIFYR